MPGTRPRSDAKPPEDDGPANPISSGVKLTPANEKLRAQVEGIYQGVGMLVMMGDPVYGTQILTASEPISYAWIELAETNAKVKQFLQKFVSGGAAGQVIALHIALFIPLLAKKGLIPSELANFVQGMPETPDYPPDA